MSKRGRKEEIKQNVFFTKTGLDKDFVDTLADQVNVFVLNRGSATVEDTYKFIQQKGFSTVEVRREEVLSLLEKLVFDGLLEEVINQQSTTLYTQKIYKPAKVNNPLCPLTCVPCGNCKLANKCFPDNPDCNPRICPYFNELLKYEDEDNEEEEEFKSEDD
ncbi:DNA-directed RNA polymerase III subunit RPC6 [Entamoeba marina]